MNEIKKDIDLKRCWLSISFLIIFSSAHELIGMPSTPQGLDTVAISDDKIGDQGNWVKKKQWLLKTYEVADRIYNLTLQIEETKKIFRQKYDAINEELDKFYMDNSFEQGKNEELFKSIERYLEKKKKKETATITLTAEKPPAGNQDFRIKIELLENQLHSISNELAQLKLDMESIRDGDKELTDRLQTIDGQITSAMSLEEEAKSKIENLWDIIDDKKARAIYYDSLNIEEKLKAISSFLTNTMAQDFDNVIQIIKTQIANTTTSIKKLEGKELIIKNRAQRVEELKIAELQKLELETVQTKKEVTPAPVIKKEKELGIVQKIYKYLTEIVAKITIFVTNIFSKKISTNNVDLHKEQPAPQQSQQSTVTPTQAVAPAGSTPDSGIPLTQVPSSTMQLTAQTPVAQATTPVAAQAMQMPLTMPLTTQ